MKAHQRLIREQLVGAAVLDGHWPAQHGAALDIGAAEVRQISYAEARELIEQHEYLGRMPAVASHCFGIFFGDRLGGAVVYGDEYGENLKVWDKYGYSGKIICLKRGASAHWAHPNTASKLIRRSMKLLPERFKVVTATVDPRAGEIGVVYKACGFHYVGQLSANRTRLRVHDGQTTISERQARARYGTSSIAELQARGLKIERVPRPSRYFAFRGSRSEQKALRAAIAGRLLPYPKRTAVVVNFPGVRAAGVGGKTASVGFVKTRRRTLKDGRSAISFDLVRAVRVPGKNGSKPTNLFVAALGSQRSDRDDARFWPRAIERMVAHGLSEPQRRRLVDEMKRKGARGP